MARLRILRSNFQNKLNRALNRGSYADTALRNLDSKFEAARRDALRTMDQHPVTTELLDEKSGPRVFSRGNVASVLGIYEGDGAALISALRSYVESPSTFRINGLNFGFKNLGSKGVVYIFGVIAPSIKDFYEATPAQSGTVQWSKKSWTQLLEEGVPYYGGMVYSKTLFSNKSSSRSKQAIQKKNGGSSPAEGVPYVREIRRAFFDRLGI